MSDFDDLANGILASLLSGDGRDFSEVESLMARTIGVMPDEIRNDRSLAALKKNGGGGGSEVEVKRDDDDYDDDVDVDVEPEATKPDDDVDEIGTEVALPPDPPLPPSTTSETTTTSSSSTANTFPAPDETEATKLSTPSSQTTTTSSSSSSSSSSSATKTTTTTTLPAPLPNPNVVQWTGPTTIPEVPPSTTTTTTTSSSSSSSTTETTTPGAKSTSTLTPQQKHEEKEKKDALQSQINAIPLGPICFKMLVTFGDGSSPLPSTLLSVLTSVRTFLQYLIRDCRACRRSDKKEYERARILANLHSRSDDSWMKKFNDVKGEEADSINPDIIFRQMKGYDNLAFDVKAGFDYSCVKSLFPEETFLFEKWRRMEERIRMDEEKARVEMEEKAREREKRREEKAKEKEKKGKKRKKGKVMAKMSKKKMEGEENEEEDEEEEEEDISDVSDTDESNSDNSDNEENDEEEEEDEEKDTFDYLHSANSHNSKRLSRFNIRTCDMTPDWYVSFSEDFRRGSFLPTNRSNVDTSGNSASKRHNHAHTSTGSWKGVLAGTARFLYWIGFDPNDSLAPPNDETTHLLAFLAYDAVGRIVEKSLELMFLDEIAKGAEVLELRGGMQLTVSHVERALKSSALCSALFGAREGGGKRRKGERGYVGPAAAIVVGGVEINDVHRSDMIPSGGSLYFGPGCESRMEKEMENLAPATEVKRRVSRKVETEDRTTLDNEDEIFDKIAKPFGLLKQGTDDYEFFHQFANHKRTAAETRAIRADRIAKGLPVPKLKWEGNEGGKPSNVKASRLGPLKSYAGRRTTKIFEKADPSRRPRLKRRYCTVIVDGECINYIGGDDKLFLLTGYTGSTVSIGNTPENIARRMEAKERAKTQRVTLEGAKLAHVKAKQEKRDEKIRVKALKVAAKAAKRLKALTPQISEKKRAPVYIERDVPLVPGSTKLLLDDGKTVVEGWLMKDAKLASIDDEGMCAVAMMIIEVVYVRPGHSLKKGEKLARDEVHEARSKQPKVVRYEEETITFNFSEVARFAKNYEKEVARKKLVAFKVKREMLDLRQTYCKLQKAGQIELIRTNATVKKAELRLMKREEELTILYLRRVEKEKGLAGSKSESKEEMNEKRRLATRRRETKKLWEKAAEKRRKVNNEAIVKRNKERAVRRVEVEKKKKERVGKVNMAAANKAKESKAKESEKERKKAIKKLKTGDLVWIAWADDDEEYVCAISNFTSVGWSVVYHKSDVSTAPKFAGKFSFDPNTNKWKVFRKKEEEAKVGKEKFWNDNDALNDVGDVLLEGGGGGKEEEVVEDDEELEVAPEATTPTAAEGAKRKRGKTETEDEGELLEKEEGVGGDESDFGVDSERGFDDLDYDDDESVGSSDEDDDDDEGGDVYNSDDSSSGGDDDGDGDSDGDDSGEDEEDPLVVEARKIIEKDLVGDSEQDHNDEEEGGSDDEGGGDDSMEIDEDNDNKQERKQEPLGLGLESFIDI